MFSACSIEVLVSLIHYRKTAAQDQALRTNSIRKRIDGEDISPLCRMCGEREEKIGLIVTQCKKLAQKEYEG